LPFFFKQAGIREFSKIVTEIDMFNYVGQFLELNYLGIESFNFNIDLKDYLDIYLKIKYLYGGKWIRDLLLTGILFSEKKSKLLTETIEKFGVYCGTVYTMVNDLSDFCLLKIEGGYKTFIEDQFKDVWNGRVTLPLCYTISKYSLASKEEKGFLIDCMKRKHRKNLTNMKKIQKILIKSGALDFSYSLMNYLGKEAKRIIKKLPKSPERGMLILLNTTLRANKFFYELKKEGMKIVKLNHETVKYLESFWKNIVVRR
jgi:geranylgeranyl pyrophosphate synthase